MVSNVLASTAILRRPFRRLRYLGLLGTACAVGLIPLVLYMPKNVGARYILLLFVCLYAGRKIVQYFRSHAALKQISMDEHFLRYVATGGSIQKCVENDDHMWTRSRILTGLKGLMDSRLPNNMLIGEKHQRVLQRYRRSFEKLIPRASLLDIVLLIGVILLLAWTPTASVDLRAFIYQAGFLALIVAMVSEGSHFVVNRRLIEGLGRFFQTLAEWTIREGLQRLEHSGPYSHQLHYFAPPWFAAVATPDDSSVTESLDMAAEGDIVLPPSVSADDGDADAK